MRKGKKMRVQQGGTQVPGPKRVNDSMIKAAGCDEGLLVAQAKSGQSSAFGELYEHHRVRVYHTAFRILRNAQDAEDASQRSFQRAFINLKSFRGESTFSTWLTRIAMNESLMMLRQRRSNVRTFECNGNENHEFSVANLVDSG